LIQRANITVDVEKLNTLLTAIIPE